MHMQIKFFIIAALLFCFQISSGYYVMTKDSPFRDMKDIDGFKTRFEASTNLINSIESSFTQEKHLKVISEVVKSKGHFYFMKENKLRWQYDKPYQFIIVFNNDKIILKDTKKTTVLDAKSNDMFKKITEIMAMSLQGKVLGVEDFNVSYFESDELYLLKIIPQNKEISDLFSIIKIYIDKKDYSVSMLEFSEKTGDYTKIIFSGRKLNQKIDDEKFNIK